MSLFVNKLITLSLGIGYYMIFNIHRILSTLSFFYVEVLNEKKNYEFSSPDLLYEKIWRNEKNVTKYKHYKVSFGVILFSPKN